MIIRKNKIQKIKALRAHGVEVDRDFHLCTARVAAFSRAWDHDGMWLAAKVCREFNIVIEDDGEILSDF